MLWVWGLIGSNVCVYKTPPPIHSHPNSGALTPLCSENHFAIFYHNEKLLLFSCNCHDNYDLLKERWSLGTCLLCSGSTSLHIFHVSSFCCCKPSPMEILHAKDLDMPGWDRKREKQIRSLLLASPSCRNTDKQVSTSSTAVCSSNQIPFHFTDVQYHCKPTAAGLSLPHNFDQIICVCSTTSLFNISHCKSLKVKSFDGIIHFLWNGKSNFQIVRTLNLWS